MRLRLMLNHPLYSEAERDQAMQFAATMVSRYDAAVLLGDDELVIEVPEPAFIRALHAAFCAQVSAA